MTILTAIDTKPMDFLYDLIGGEDRRNAPEGLAELYDDLGGRKEWVDRFNEIVEGHFPPQTMDYEVERYLKENWREIGAEIFPAGFGNWRD